MTERAAKGRFQKGRSGNPRGRPPREKPSHRTPALNRRLILDIAEREIEVKMAGEVKKMSFFEANLMRLAIAGAGGDRIASRQFVQLVADMAHEEVVMKVRMRGLNEEMSRLASENQRMRDLHEQRTGVVIAPYDWGTSEPEPEGYADDGRTMLDGDTSILTLEQRGEELE